MSDKEEKKNLVKTYGDIAIAFGVNGRTIRNWAADGMPGKKDGFYDIDEITAWRAEYEKTATGANWEASYREAKAKLAHLELQRKSGELVSRDEVEAAQVERILEVKTAFLALPKQIATKLVGLEPREIEVILTGEIEDIIERFARDENDDVEPAHEGGVETPREDISQSVGG